MSERAFFFDGTNLVDLVDTITSFKGVFAPMTRRVMPDVIPGKRGQSAPAGSVFDAFTFSIGCGIYKRSEAQFDEAMLALGPALVGPANDGLGTIDRHLAKTGGGHYTQTAAGLFVGIANLTEGATDGPTTAFFDLQFTNLDGAWKDSVSHEWITP